MKKLLFLATALCLLSPAVATPTIDVFINGKRLSPAPVQTIPYSQEVVFKVTQRMRYTLEGFDPDWIERTGPMHFSIFYLNEAGDRIGQVDFPIEGKSKGWEESLEDCAFLHHRKELAVPAGAVKASVVISSAGPDSAVGIVLVKNIVITAPGQTAPETLLDSHAPSNMSQWVTDGTRPSMARIINVPGPDGPIPVFGIIDDDIAAHADWRLVTAPRVSPGEQITVQWDDLYNTGMGDPAVLSYSHLQPGNYRLRVQEVDLWGHLLPGEYDQDLVIPLPYWQSAWFWAAMMAGGGALLFFAIRAHYQRRIQQQMLIEQERLRIARDLHDDLGTQLAYISLVSSHSTVADDAPDRLRAVSAAADEMVSSLSEIVWTVNPKNDHLQSLVGFLCRRIQRECEALGVRGRIDSLGVTQTMPVSSEVRHHISLSVREAVSNALKYSGSRELNVVFSFDKPNLKIEISDTGKGFVPEAATNGNGLDNMKKRMAAIRGKVIISSKPGEGTAICFEIPLSRSV